MTIAKAEPPLLPTFFRSEDIISWGWAWVARHWVDSLSGKSFNLGAFHQWLLLSQQCRRFFSDEILRQQGVQTFMSGLVGIHANSFLEVVIALWLWWSLSLLWVVS